MDKNKGKVYLTGAGPGDEKLITVKAAEALAGADVVVYDYLASIDLEKYAPQAEKIYVGKTGRKHTIEQLDINALLVKLANEGKKIVRLKGGDPFIFGRGGEEALELVKAGVDFEIIPGISSAYAAPAYAGIPITQRGNTSTVAFITGHEDPTKDKSDIDFKALATGIGTLVFLMGVKNLNLIAENLLKHGRDPKTPVALVRWGTTSKQQVLEGTLADIAEKALLTKFKAPAIIVIGEVAALREQLAWFEKKPLFGKTVVVTRSREQASELSQDLQELGASTIELPSIKVVPADSYKKLDEAIERQIPGAYYDWLIFTSVNGVIHFVRRLKQKDVDFRVFKDAKIAAIGPGTASYLKSLALKVDLIPQEYKAEGILKALGDVKDKKILLPRAKVAREVLPEELTKAGAKVDVVEAYQTVADKPASEQSLKAMEKKVDFVTFTSSSTVVNFLDIVENAKAVLNGVKIAAIGPITAKTAKDKGLKVDIVAKEYTIKGLVKAIVDNTIKIKS